MDLLTSLLAAIAGYFAIAWKSEKDKADKQNAKELERLKKWAKAVGCKVKVPFDEGANIDDN